MGSSKKGKSKDLEKKGENKGEKKKEEKPKFFKQPEMKTLLRVANTDLDASKNIVTGIKGIKGVNHTLANAVMKVTGLDPHRKINSLDPAEIQKIEEVIRNPSSFGIPNFMLNRIKDPNTGKDIHLSGADVFTAAKFDVQKHVDIKSYRGWRHMLGQPVRGQRTRSHFRLGRVVGVLRKEVKAQGGKAEGAAGAAAAPAKKEEKK